MRIKNRYKDILYPCISNSVFAINDRNEYGNLIKKISSLRLKDDFWTRFTFFKEFLLYLRNLTKTNPNIYNSYTYTNHNLCELFVHVYSHSYYKHEFQYLHFENSFLNETDWMLHDNKFVKASEIK